MATHAVVSRFGLPAILGLWAACSAPCWAAAAAQAETRPQLQEVEIRFPDRLSHTEYHLSDDWLDVCRQPQWLADPWVRWPFWAGKEFSLDWVGWRLYVEADGGPRKLAVIAIAGEEELAELNKAIEGGISPLTICWWDRNLKRLPKVPATIEVALILSSREPVPVAELAEKLPGLTALSIDVRDKAASPKLLEDLPRLDRLRRLHLDWCGQPPIPPLTPLAKLKELRALYLSQLMVGNKPHLPMPSLAPLAALKELRSLELHLTLGGDGPQVALPDLEPLVALPRLASLELWGGDLTDEHLDSLRRMKGLVALSLSVNDLKRGVEPLGELAGLVRLDLRGHLWKGRGLQCLAKLTQLKSLGLAGFPELLSIAPLGALKELRDLDIRCADKLSDLSPLAALPKLRSVRFYSLPSVKDLSPSGQVDSLRRVDLESLDGVEDVSPLARLGKLEQLRLGDSPKVHDLDALARLPKLRELELIGRQPLADLAPLAALSELRHLCLARLDKVQDLSPVGKLDRLAFLAINGCSRVNDLSPLGGLRNLDEFWIYADANIRDLTPLSRLAGLRRLFLLDCDELSDLSPLQNCPKLSYLYLANCAKVKDLTPLRPIVKRGGTLVVPPTLQAQLKELRDGTDF